MTGQIPIFVINLDRAPERMAFVQSQFAAAGLPGAVVRFPARDAQDRDFAAPGYAPASWRDRWSLRRSEQAVFESHRAVWQRIAAGAASAAVVCEDDILVSALMAEALQDLEIDRYGVIKLDGFSASRRYGPAIDMGRFFVRDILGPVPSAACYALGPVAARRLLEDSARYCVTLDDFVFGKRRGLRPVQLFPAVAVQGMCVKDAAAVPAPVLHSEREAGQTPQDRADKGPWHFRLAKEALRSAGRIRRALGADRRLRAEGGLIACPDLAPDLPPYR